MKKCLPESPAPGRPWIPCGPVMCQASLEVQRHSPCAQGILVICKSASYLDPSWTSGFGVHLLGGRSGDPGVGGKCLRNRGNN